MVALEGQYHLQILVQNVEMMEDLKVQTSRVDKFSVEMEESIHQNNVMMETLQEQ